MNRDKLKSGAKNLAREIPGIALTGARLWLAHNIAKDAKNQKPIGLKMGAFILADILDGVILRKMNADTPLRRATDGVVDNLSVGMIAKSIYNANPSSRKYLKIIAGRAVLVAGLNSYHFAKTGEPTKGGTPQRIYDLADAIFAVADAKNQNTELAGKIAAGVAIATVPAHLKEIGDKNMG